MLQETHIMKAEQISSIYTKTLNINPHKSNSAGVITFLSDDFKILHTYRDNTGRLLVNIIQTNHKEKFIITNIYCPNDHRQSIIFIDNVYNKILELLNAYPDAQVIMGGDFNCCMSDIDYLNRNKQQIEIDLTDLIHQN
jgi:exonuclease III